MQGAVGPFYKGRIFKKAKLLQRADNFVASGAYVRFAHRVPVNVVSAHRVPTTAHIIMLLRIVLLALQAPAVWATACADDPTFTGPYDYYCSQWIVNGQSECSTTAFTAVTQCGTSPQSATGIAIPAVDDYGVSCEVGGIYHADYWYWTAEETAAIRAACPVACNACPTPTPTTSTAAPTPTPTTPTAGPTPTPTTPTAGETACADDPTFTGPYGYSCSQWIVNGQSECSTTAFTAVTQCGTSPQSATGIAIPAVDDYGVSCEVGGIYHADYWYWTAEETAAIRAACPVACNACPTPTPTTSTAAPTPTPTTPTAATARRDPHLTLAHGGTSARSEANRPACPLRFPALWLNPRVDPDARSCGLPWHGW